MAKTVLRQLSEEELNQLLKNIVQETSKTLTEVTGTLVSNKELTTNIQTLQSAIIKSTGELLKKQEKLSASKSDVNSSTDYIQKSLVDLLKKLTLEQASKSDLDKTTTESLKKQESLFASKKDADNNTVQIQQAISDANNNISDQILSASKSSDDIILASFEKNLNNVMKILLEKFVTLPEIDKKHDELKTEVGMILEANKGKLRSEFRTVVEANNEAIRAEFKGLLEANNRRLVQDISEQLVDSLESIIEKNLQKKVKETLANVKLKID